MGEDEAAENGRDDNEVSKSDKNREPKEDILPGNPASEIYGEIGKYPTFDYGNDANDDIGQDAG